MAEPAGSEASSSAARAKNSRLFSTTGGQGAPSERSGVHPEGKLAASARTTARSLKLGTCTSIVRHALDKLGITAGLPGAERNRGHTGRGGEPPQEREHIAKQPALEEQPHQRRPLRRSSMRAHSM